MHESNERQQLLVDIARMYYFENLSQQQIADTLHMSRSNISLLLKSCLENHIIEIKINDTVSMAHDVASQIKARFGLQNVLIAKTYNSSNQTIASVARLAAHFLDCKCSEIAARINLLPMNKLKFLRRFHKSKI